VPRPSARNPDLPKELDNLVVSLMSKEVSDRPLDAAAVAHRLRRLQEKDRRGEPIAMVFGPKPDGSRAAAASPRPRAGATEAAAGRPPVAIGDRLAAVATDRRVGTALLVAALLGSLGLGAYLFVITTWPPRDTLYRHAKELMASQTPSDWSIALRSAIEPLDRRFPDHPYRQETRAWRDRILLRQATDRARILDSARGLGGPQTPTEELYTTFSRRAAEAGKLNRFDQAAQRWRELAAALEGRDDPQARMWWLLARARAARLVADREVTRRARLKAAARLLDLADEQQEAGQEAGAIQMRRDLLEQYGPAAASDPELARLLERARAGVPALPPGPEAPPPAPEPAPAVPDAAPRR
jgi:eukaryotic-like serine/threonine-protein kinase